jgi:hypothetical protein
MPKVASDFKTHPFDVAKVDSGGKDLGGKVYWRLYGTLTAF